MRRSCMGGAQRQGATDAELQTSWQPPSARSYQLIFWPFTAFITGSGDDASGLLNWRGAAIRAPHASRVDHLERPAARRRLCRGHLHARRWRAPRLVEPALTAPHLRRRGQSLLPASTCRPRRAARVARLIRMWHDDAERPLLATSLTEWLTQYITALEAGEYTFSEDYDGIVCG